MSNDVLSLMQHNFRPASVQKTVDRYTVSFGAPCTKEDFPFQGSRIPLRVDPDDTLMPALCPCIPLRCCDMA